MEGGRGSRGKDAAEEPATPCGPCAPVRKDAHVQSWVQRGQCRTGGLL